MISWLMRFWCFWCKRSVIGMCWQHHEMWRHRLNLAGRVALVVIGAAFAVALTCALAAR